MKSQRYDQFELRAWAQAEVTIGPDRLGAGKESANLDAATVLSQPGAVWVSLGWRAGPPGGRSPSTPDQ